MSSTNVIVFGATGSVGSIAARSAHHHGANVFLAVRSLDKPIPGLSKEDEEKGGFKRVQADLTQPDTVAEAIEGSKSTHAFIYLAFAAGDSMRATLEAMKGAGIKLLVFLSSYTIPDDPKTVEPQELIPFVHAQVEINLEKVFGSEGYIALRPGTFATNSLTWWKTGIQSGDAKIYCPEVKFDNITPIDMGRVAGGILAKGRDGVDKHVYLYGPKMLSQRESIGIIAKSLGKEVKVTAATKEEGLELYRAGGAPEPIAQYLVKVLGYSEGGHDVGSNKPSYEKGVANIEKYGGHPATTFEEWVEENKQQFQE